MADKVNMAPLTDVEIKALDVIEVHWNMYDLWPDVEEIKQKIPGFSPARSFIKDRFLNALHNRGLPAPPVDPGEARKYESRLEGLDTDDFSPSQIAVVVTLTDFYDQRSDQAKLKALGVSTQTFNGWMRNREFKRFFTTMSKKHFAESDHLARKGLIKGMDRGDLASIKYFNELTGESPEERNVQVLLSRIVEAIQLHVKDPATLHRIEQSFAEILGRAQAIDADVVEHAVPSPIAQLESVINNGVDI